MEGIEAGDHLLYQIGCDKFRKDYRSALVSEVYREQNEMMIITFTSKGVKEERVRFTSLCRLHKVKYSTCRFPPEQAVLRAHQRQRMYENSEKNSEENSEKNIEKNSEEKKRAIYNPMDNNGHFFVSNAKTGREHNLSDMIMDLKAQDAGKCNQNFSPFVKPSSTFWV